MGCTKDIAVGRISLFGAHLVVESIGGEVRRHLRAAAQFVDELLIEPRLVDPQVRIGQQAVAIEPLDVVAFEGGAITPDVNPVFLHCRYQHRASHSATKRCGVEVRGAAGGDVEGTRLNGCKTFVDQLRTAIHESGLFGAEV